MESGMLVWIPLFPLIGTLVSGAISMATSHRETAGGKGIAGGVACLAPTASFLVTVWAFLQLRALPEGSREMTQHLFAWIGAGRLQVDLGLLFDPLSAAMLLFVTGVGALIHYYSLGYIAHDRGYARYFAFLNLFTFSMILLVLGDGLLPMFIGWEGVGLCSYLLIGFWHTDEEKAIAGNKAFIVNRIGDFGFLIGIFLIFWALVSGGHATGLSYREVAAASHHLPAGVVLAASLLLFVGATGKSAQLPLYVWLPDAMAGPTPVSALIHAATMVTSGIYMISRLSFLFVEAPVALTVVAIVGALTALFAATIGLAQNDIKKVLAYSTVSQLGYMFLAVGVGAFAAGMFHVVTHAFFKALLFLGAGSVIHALHEEQDIRKMGGLLKHIPTTGWTFLVGWLAICGIVPFAGFFSKDEILWEAFSRPNEILPWLPGVLWAIGFVTAGITALYMTRLVGLVFFGRERVEPERRAKIHESPATMTVPLVILAIGSAVVGFLGIPEFLVEGGNRFGAWLGPALAGGHHGAAHEVHHDVALEWTLMLASLGIAILGIGLGWFLYVRRPDLPAAIAARAGGLYRLVANKYYVDEIYRAVIV
ncbi:MAG: NADH-quinone oxidoreductase subunit L, partial [Candidatus Eisenbacteria bacterium]|nr:NADH-quinone oxidoreductase subunit L [Candidatus Latescibacterota bacterium]MBD3303032.1 NADH-quinone oxidoreductase subunit L [Candidatus Eisenbacteria bacterium]